MASQPNNENFDRRRALSLLEQATQYIREYGDIDTAQQARQGNNSSGNMGERTERCRPSTHDANEAGANTDTRRGRELENFRNLFGPYREARPVSRSSAHQRPLPPPSKCRRGSSAFHFKRETWTHDFFCFADSNQMAAPSKALKLQLQQAGLGRKRICFHSKGTASDLKAKLEETYPKLSKSGGFDILRSGSNSGELIVLHPPQQGYTVSYLRDVAGLGQAIAYIRPLQANLNTDPIKTDAAETCQGSEAGPTVACVHCDVEFPVSCIRNHLKLCCDDDEISSVPDVILVDETKEPSSSIKCENCHQLIAMSNMAGHGEICGGGSSTSTQPVNSPNICSYFHVTSTVGNVSEASEGSESADKLQQIFPTVSRSTIDEALIVAKGECNKAVTFLLNHDCFPNSDSDTQSECTYAMSPLPDIEEPVLTVEDLIGKHKSILGLDGVQRFHISRQDVWSDSVAAFKNHEFKVLAKPRVSFEGEPGVDAGGLSREYAALLRQALFSSKVNMFEGKENRKLPIYSIEGIHSRLYHLVGKMVAYLIIHTGVGIPCLSAAAYKYIASGSMDIAADMCCTHDVVDLELRELINQVNEAETDDDLIRISTGTALTDALVNAGYLRPLNLKDKTLAMQSLLVYDVLLKRKEPMDQFRKGLETLDVLRLVESHPAMMESFFTDIGSEKITSDYLIANLSPCALDKEEFNRAYHFLIDAIILYEKDQGRDGLVKLLHFITSLDEIPPLGLPHTIDIEFDETDQRSFFAETCTFVLRVPTVHSTFSSFEGKFGEACENYMGFGSV